MPEERSLQAFLMGVPLEDLGAHGEAQLGYFPVACRQVFESSHPERLTGRCTCALAKREYHRVLRTWLGLCGLHTADPISWWEALKGEVCCCCKALGAVAYDRDLASYHRALGRHLRRLAQVNWGRACEVGAEEDERVLAEFHRRWRERRLARQRCRARGPLVDCDEWEWAHAGVAGAGGARVCVQLRGAVRGVPRPRTGDSGWHAGCDGAYYGAKYASEAVAAFLRRGLFPSGAAEDGGGSSSLAASRPPMEAECAAMCAPVSQQEVRDAIHAGRGGSAPGEDGLPYAFYQAFQELLAVPLADAFSAELTGRSRFRDGFLRGLLRFLHKGNDPTLARNWRPLTISNVDYRLLAWVLLARLAPVAS
ncbi:hypothetical protein lerEdw1_014518 [Lerista edwardsae]|nr:hypothetical protein lerEdw1_014523 [Lerista edwardsae]KAJ6633379.1 hypothetical protein lerEdw1_014518 [Lerista edwardsae]